MWRETGDSAGFVRFHAKNKVYEEVKVKVLRAAHVAIDLKSGRG